MTQQKQEPTEHSTLYSSESKPAIPLLFILVIATAAIAWFGSDLVPSSVHRLDMSFTYPNVSTKSKKEQIDLGNDLQEQKCSGCHAISQRIVGPSYKDILASFEQEGNDFGMNSEAQKLAMISAGIEHPKNNKWPNFPRGPAVRPPQDELAALTIWILNSQHQADENTKPDGADSSQESKSSEGESK